MGGLLVVLLVVSLCWCIVRLKRTQSELEIEKQEIKQLQDKCGKLQQRLHARGARLDVLLSSITEVVLRVDREGRVLWGNEQASALFQLDKYDALPQAMLLFHRDYSWLKHYQQALRQLPKPLELPDMLVQGRVLMPRLVSLSKDEALLLCLDITEHVQLQRKQKTLLANLMHDLKTPLTSLLGYARSIEAFAEDKALRAEAVNVIANEAKHISELMNSMLTLEQVEHQHPQGVSCDAVAVCSQVWESLQAKLEEKNITLNLQLLDTMQVKMMEEDCHRVLMNIAENAVKFSWRNTCITSSMQVDKEILTLRIQDAGCGIAEQHLPRVTERFYRVDAARNKQQQGFGLGLAIVKEILEHNHGSLHLKNSDEGGLLVVIKMAIAQE
ncbi:MAG: ATP-binding protein [Ghiorsea sp.]